MAEVESSTTTAAAMPVPAADIPLSSKVGVDNGATTELGTSPTQERSSNSHPHDSEYDTASDLEGGEDYDDDDDDDDSDSDDGTESEDDDDDGTETDDDEEAEINGVNEALSEKLTDAEEKKKVDEDRSNPQYIPKRGTFYEHDDRTAEGEVDPKLVIPISTSTAETGVDSSNIIGIGVTPSTQTPTISQASKTMKKWQPASGGDRWSHDRFDASEQAPKSRTELLASYGYDIRNEDAPPRARRRRRYGRGPSKYSRNWEDEQAYLKASNKERKPPRPSDFPALNERGPKERRSRGSRSREEKENRGERRLDNATVSNDKHHNSSGGSGGAPASGNLPERSSYDNRDRKNKNYGRRSNGPSDGGRQPPREFKQKSNRNDSHRVDPRDRVRERDNNNRADRSAPKSNTPRSNAPNSMPSKQIHLQNDMHQQLPSEPQLQKQQQQGQSNYQTVNTPVVKQQQQPQQHQPQQPQPQQTTSSTHSNISQRLQQVQQRNDPSHVGSVQMHALATQNQQHQQQQQQQLHINQQQQQQHQQQQITPQMNNNQQQPQQIIEQRTSNGPKRYSSMRRSQHEAAQAQHHLVDQQQQQQQQHQLQQQLQLQQQQQQQQQSQLMLQDPHMLMQIYEQQQLQAQMQTLQIGQPAPSSVQQPPKQHAPPPNAYTQAQAAPAAYYVTGAEQVPQTAPYVNPSAAGYLPPAPPAVVYAQTQTPAPPAQPPQGPPATQATQPPPINYHQNYNTVGGTTYFVPPPQTTSRPAVLPQRRPTNAIPILPPSEIHKPRGANTVDARPSTQSTSTSKADESIDHILDNMFVQRPLFQTSSLVTANEKKAPVEEISTLPAATTEQANTGTPAAATKVQE